MPFFLILSQFIQNPDATQILLLMSCSPRKNFRDMYIVFRRERKVTFYRIV